MKLKGTIEVEAGGETLEFKTILGRTLRITVGESAGLDKATIVFVDTDFEPDGSDGEGGLRIMLNDSDTYIGVQYEPIDEEV